MRAAALGVAVVLAFVACSSSEQPDTAPGTGASTTAPALAPAIGPPLIEGIDLPAITLMTAATGVGERPLLEWSAVASAARYDVLVFGPDGEIYWAWSTSDTSVFLGGVETTNPNAPGPKIRPGMTWAVLGVNRAGLPVAQSDLRPISP